MAPACDQSCSRDARRSTEPASTASTAARTPTARVVAKRPRLCGAAAGGAALLRPVALHDERAPRAPRGGRVRPRPDPRRRGGLLRVPAVDRLRPRPEHRQPARPVLDARPPRPGHQPLPNRHRADAPARLPRRPRRRDGVIGWRFRGANGRLRARLSGRAGGQHVAADDARGVGRGAGGRAWPWPLAARGRRRGVAVVDRHARRLLPPARPAFAAPGRHRPGRRFSSGARGES